MRGRKEGLKVMREGGGKEMKECRRETINNRKGDARK